MVNFGVYVERLVATREVTRDRLALINRIEDLLDVIGRWSEAYLGTW